MQPPTELRVAPDRKTLTPVWPDTPAVALEAELLRVLSPSAEVQGHSPDQRLTVGGKRDVRISGMEPVGNYAVRITFSDGHNTGIFGWDYLAELAKDYHAKWQAYLAELEDKGLTRG